LAFEFSLFSALMVLFCIAIYEVAAIPGIVLITALVISSFFVTLSLVTGTIVSQTTKTKKLDGFEDNTSHSDIMSYEDKSNIFDNEYDYQKEDLKSVETMVATVNDMKPESVDMENSEAKNNMFDAWVRTVEAIKHYQKENMQNEKNMDASVNDNCTESVVMEETETKMNMFDAWIKTVETMSDNQNEDMKNMETKDANFEKISEKVDMETKNNFDDTESHETEQNVATN